MIVFKQADTLENYLNHRKQEGKAIGFAPTMGALHPGHISLIEKSKSACDLTVSSIFVNPTQFNDPKDFQKYPVTISNDILLLETAGCDILFLPSVNEIYPDGTDSKQHYDLGEIEFLLEGKFRPGHFQGVCQVVHRLLNIVQPHSIFMGQKDYQQCLEVNQLIKILGLPVTLITAATYREPSGLAMSSRNLRLSEAEKQSATGISKMLQYIKDNLGVADFPVLKKYVTDYLLATGFNKVDYVSIADAETLREEKTFLRDRKLVALIAAFIGDVRLIDNMVLSD